MRETVKTATKPANVLAHLLVLQSAIVGCRVQADEARPCAARQSYLASPPIEDSTVRCRETAQDARQCIPHCAPRQREATTPLAEMRAAVREAENEKENIPCLTRKLKKVHGKS